MNPTNPQDASRTHEVDRDSVFTTPPPSMSPNGQRVAIAEVCGWSGIRPSAFNNGMFVGVQPNAIYKDERTFLPDYIGDLNAMHEAEKVLSEIGGMECASRYRFGEILFEMIGGSYGPDGENESGDSNFLLAHATAAQRAEAFLKTFHLCKPQRDAGETG